jgi:hypothetical protein
MNKRNFGGLAVLLAGAASLAFAAFLALPAAFRLALAPEPADVAELRQAPHVARVEAPVRPHDATRRIIHVLDYHWVPRELYEGPEPYEEHLADVAAVQAEQVPLLRHLATRFALKAVYLEGLTAETAAAYRERVAWLRQTDRKTIPALYALLLKEHDRKSPEVGRARDAYYAMQAAHREKLPGVGAPGRLLLAGGLEEVRPLDDAETLAAADPRKADAATLKARDDAIVRNALAGSELVVVVVLGGGHDLAESVRAVDPHCGYVRVTTGKVVGLMGGR